uniref:RNA transcription, translation and transport factor protein n=1 Tax=Oreochromis niloticus TaxID=8128 RepID=A0A669BP98_ORENI
MLYDSADVVLEPQFYLFTPFLSFTYWPNVAADELLSVLSRFRSDATQFWNCIVWLGPEDPALLKSKTEHRQDVNCPFGVDERKEAVDWFLGLAVRYEYGDNGKEFNLVHIYLYTSSNSDKAVDPLVNLDNFKAGVTALSNILKIQRHDDYLVMLKALRILIQERLSPEAIAKVSNNREVN